MLGLSHMGTLALLLSRQLRASLLHVAVPVLGQPRAVRPQATCQAGSGPGSTALLSIPHSHCEEGVG